MGSRDKSVEQFMFKMNIVTISMIVLLSIIQLTEGKCKTDKDCAKVGVRQCVKRKGGLSCFFGNCKSYGVCAQCFKDSDCKRIYGLDDCIKNFCYLRDYFRDPANPIWTNPQQPIALPPVYPPIVGGQLIYQHHLYPVLNNNFYVYK